MPQRAQKLRATKSKLDTIHNELATTEADLEKLTAVKHYPEAMKLWCAGKLQECKSEVWQKLQDKYNTEAARIIGPADDIDEIQAVASAWDKELSTLATCWNDWRKAGLADVKKLLD